MKTGRRACKTRRTVEVPAVVLGILITLPGCPSPEPSIDDRPDDAEAPGTQEIDSPEGVAVELFGSEGERAGRISFHPMNGVLRVWGTLHIPEIGAGERGFHIHETGACDPPDFESAGDHFDPHGTPHGSPDDPPGERHVGDLGNVSFDSEGRAEVEFLDPEISLQEGPEGIRGRSLVVHEGPDDFATQPDGDAGARVACGVIEP